MALRLFQAEQTTQAKQSCEWVGWIQRTAINSTILKHNVWRKRGNHWDRRLNPGIESGSPASQADCLPSKPPGKPNQGVGQVKLRIKMVNCRKMSWRESSWSSRNWGNMFIHPIRQHTMGKYFFMFFLLISLGFFYLLNFMEYSCLQCCVIFRWATKWICYTYTHVHSLQDFFFPCRSSQRIEHSSLCCEVGPY